MTIIFKIILTLHRVNGDSPPPSQFFHHLIHIFDNFHNLHSPILLSILLFLDHPLKKIWVRKEYRSCTSHAWVLRKEAQLPNSTIFSWFILSFTYQHDQPLPWKWVWSAFVSLSFNPKTCWAHNLHYLSKTNIVILHFWNIHLKKNHI